MLVYYAIDVDVLVYSRSKLTPFPFIVVCQIEALANTCSNYSTVLKCLFPISVQSCCLIYNAAFQRSEMAGLEGFEFFEIVIEKSCSRQVCLSSLISLSSLCCLVLDCHN